MRLAITLFMVAAVVLVIFGSSPFGHRILFATLGGALAWLARTLFFTPGDWLARGAEWCQRQAEV